MGLGYDQAGWKGSVIGNMVKMTQSGVVYALGSNLENLNLTGVVAINGTGNTLNNTITGNTAANILDGGAGTDTLIGGAGDDTYIVDLTVTNTLQDIITETASGGVDTLRLRGGAALTTYTTLTLGAEIDNLDASATGTTLLNLTGNALNNTLTGNAANNILDGGVGADAMIGGMGNDTYIVDNLADVIVENVNEGADLANIAIATAGGTYTIAANVENATLNNLVAFNIVGNQSNNILTGNAAINTLNGGAGNDILNGLGGNDTMLGGLGDDTYTIDVLTDVITENTNEGTDLVNVAVATAGQNYTLGANLENAALTNTVAYNLTGNDLSNVLNGNAAANIIYGGIGNDVINGGDGSDIINGGIGDDSLDGGASDLAGIATTDTLNGDAGNDVFWSRGFYGAGIYNGGEGVDWLDFSQSNGISSQIRSSEGVGVGVSLALGKAYTYTKRSTDTVQTASNMVLTLTGIENVRGTSQGDIVVGNAAANLIEGGAGDDFLYANSANDNPIDGTLDIVMGGVGNDTFGFLNIYGTGSYNGGDGADTVDFSNSLVTFRDANGIGVYVNLATSYGSTYFLTSTSSYYNLSYTNLALSSIENISGTTQGDYLVGDTNANVINGVSGNDIMIGGLGDDIYTIDVLTDVITENTNEGIDLVNVGVATAGQTYTLAANIENAALTNAVAYNLTGNDLNNALTGNGMINILNGGAGNDILNGLDGNDAMTGGLGNDSFNFSSTLSANNIDTISDFLSGTDKIVLNSVIFTKLLNDTNLSDNLIVGGSGVKAIDANDYLIYNNFSKGLFYDADGSGLGTAVQFATLTNISTVSASDFVVI